MIAKHGMINGAVPAALQRQLRGDETVTRLRLVRSFCRAKVLTLQELARCSVLRQLAVLWVTGKHCMQLGFENWAAVKWLQTSRTQQLFSDDIVTQAMMNLWIEQ